MAKEVKLHKSFPTRSPRICIVIPAHNEKKRILPTLDDFKRTVIRKYGHLVTLLVVSDKSTDGTDALVRRYSGGSNRIRLIRAKEHSGKGGVPSSLSGVELGGIVIIILVILGVIYYFAFRKRRRKNAK